MQYVIGQVNLDIFLSMVYNIVSVEIQKIDQAYILNRKNDKVSRITTKKIYIFMCDFTHRTC